MSAVPNTRLVDADGNGTPALIRWMNDAARGAGGVIQALTAGSGGQSTFTFAAIPQVFHALEVLIAGRVTGAANYLSMYMQINSDATAANYDSSQDLYSSDATTTSAAIASTTSGMHVGFAVGPSANANAISEVRILIPGYAGSVMHKAVHTQYNGWTNTRRSGIVGGVWLSAAAITQLDFPAPSGSWAEGTTAVLIGK